MLQPLAGKPLLADGAMGTMLHVRGAGKEACFEEFNILNPELVQGIHRDYFAAGARLIVANTFGANRIKLSARGLDDRAEQILRAGIRLAREAAGAEPIPVAGSVGPLGVRLAPYGRMNASQASDIFRQQMEFLLDAGADLLLLETFSDLHELLVALAAAKSFAAVPVIASLTYTRDDLTVLGDSPADAARALQDAGADFIGINCSSGPAQALRILRQMHCAAPEAKLMAKPNAGWPETVGGRILYPASAAYFGSFAPEFFRAGAAIVGGCCGTTPDHIAAMRETIELMPPTSVVEVVSSSPCVEASPQEAQSASRLAEKLHNGKFVIGVEVDPPKGYSTHKLMAGVSLLAESGADVINVADSPMARMRMSPWAVCHLIQDRFGVETVLHFPTRGRNLLRVQGDLLAAHALGIRNLFVVMGDPTSIGDFPQAADNYDIVPSGLIQLIKKSLNLGVDMAGKEIGQPTSFFVGCALNLASATPEKEARTLKKKIDSGADFILTQPIFTAEPVHSFKNVYEAEFGSLPIPILAGILPLYSAKHASFLHNEVPGMTIPESIRGRIAQSGEHAAKEGVRISIELLQELKGSIQGVYLMPPFSRYEIGAEIIESSSKQ